MKFGACDGTHLNHHVRRRGVVAASRLAGPIAPHCRRGARTASGRRGRGDHYLYDCREHDR
jgi:hypothetical protein